jgi:hypothetical protein
MSAFEVFPAGRLVRCCLDADVEADGWFVRFGPAADVCSTIALASASRSAYRRERTFEGHAVSFPFDPNTLLQRRPSIAAGSSENDARTRYMGQI